MTRNTKTKTKTRQHGPRRAPARGWPGRGRGRAAYLQAPDEFRATTMQACGFWPWSTGTGSPMIGVPLGRNLLTGATLCADPISWFQRAGLISVPSCFVLGKPGLGKSSLVRRMVLGLAGYGVTPLILGDLKPDYRDLIEAMNGQVITLGRGSGQTLNILDQAQAVAAADRLAGSARDRLLADAHARRHMMVATLLTVLRGAPPSDREETILDRALHVLDDRHPGPHPPVLTDLLQVLIDAPDEVRHVAVIGGDRDRYLELTEHLCASLQGLLGAGRLGELFCGQTTTAMDLDRPVVFDVSSIDDTDTALQGAALLACWSYGFGAVSAAQAIDDATRPEGQPPRLWFCVLDELWRALRAGRGIVDRVDALTRLNRNRGVGIAMVSHTMDDLRALERPEDRTKARGFVERSGMVMCGGLPAAEMELLRGVVSLSATEEQMLIGWQDPPSWDPRTATETEPPGRGNFLVKVGSRRGIPVHVELTRSELALHDTNKRWHASSQATA